MKTPEKIIAQMDEIIFEHRNKMYGAYILRKMYGTQLVRALILSTAIMAAGLTYPVVYSYKIVKPVRDIGDTTGVIFISDLQPDRPLDPLPEPQKATEHVKTPRFVAPIPVEGAVEEEVSLNQDDYNTENANPPVDLGEEPVIAKKAEVIEIDEAEKPIIDFAQETPLFPGGESERLKFLADNITYPEDAVQNGIQGTVYIQFVVDTKGNITDVKMMRGIGGGCDEEAIRVVKMMPQWHPGRQNGMTVRVRYTMSILFKLNS